MIPTRHKEFIEKAAEVLKRDKRILGLAVGGSYITGGMDEFSDIDFVVAIDPAHNEQVMSERHEIAGRLGRLLAASTGEHVGEPRLLICLFGPPPLHVDLKFVSLKDLPHRVEDPSILWERNGAISKAYALERAEYPMPDLQWIENRFWVWVHYSAVKIGRGELFETLDSISFLRQTVIGPLIAVKDGRFARGVRKIEKDAPAYLPALKETVAGHDARSCIKAINTVIRLYRELRSHLAGNSLNMRSEAEKYATEYLDEIAQRTGCVDCNIAFTQEVKTAETVYKGNPEFETERLILRKLRKGDAQDIFAYASDTEVTEYVLWDTHKTADDSKAFIDFTLGRYEKDEAGDWGIVLKETGRLIGTIGFRWTDMSNRSAEIGYVLAKPYWGRGIIPEAAGRILKFAFEEMGLNRIECYHLLPNEKSGRVMQKLGMTYEGTAREQTFAKGRFWDVKQYAILKSDWEKGSKGAE